MHKLTILIVLTGFAFISWAQAPDDIVKCAQPFHSDSIHQANPNILEKLVQNEVDLQQWIAANKTQPSVQSIITIPVVFHVLYANDEQNVTDEQIFSQLDVLNQDYRRLNADTVLTPDRFKNISADTEIEFCLAQQTPDGLITSGIIRKAITARNIGTTSNYYKPSSGGTQIWDPRIYLNIWVCEINDTLLGYTYLPGEAQANFDGIVLNYKVCGSIPPVRPPYNKGRTLVHEIGHWLGLKHPWGDQEGCAYDDGILDTPTTEKPNQQCPNGIVITCNNAPDGDMYINYMDYTYDNCQNAFTYGQKERMVGTLNTSRKTILASNGCALPDTTQPFVERIDVFPNPIQDEMTIRFNLASEQEVTIFLYDFTGKEVYRYLTTAEQNRLVLPFPPLAQGTYIMKLFSEQLTEQFKLIKIE